VGGAEWGRTCASAADGAGGRGRPLELLGRIRAEEATRDLPVVVLTSSERREDREEALRQGATWFVCKPTDGRRFRSEVQQLGDHWARSTP
jgi:CheY-like chemotaxis protein